MLKKVQSGLALTLGRILNIFEELRQMNRFQRLLIVLFVFSNTAFALPQAGTRINMRGHLVVPGINSIDQIEIRLVSQAGVIVSRAYTNSQGDFELIGYIGTYFVESTLTGFEPIRERVDIINVASGGAAVMSLAFARTISVNRPGVDPDMIDQNKWPKAVLDEYERALDDRRRGTPSGQRPGSRES